MNLLNNITIIGLGLIGGSLAKALKKKLPNSKIGTLKGDFTDLVQAIQASAVDQIFETWNELIAWSDLIVLATPLSTLSAITEEISNRCPKEKKLLIIDVGSVKKAIIPIFELATRNNIEFLSTHPMAGKEKWGFAHSDATLFENCNWIISPHAKNHSESIRRMQRFIENLGAQPILLNPQDHDNQVALISHLPALISQLLLQFVETKGPEALKIAGPGFQSMTRLACDNPQLQSEIALLNQEELTEQFKQWLEFIQSKGLQR